MSTNTKSRKKRKNRWAWSTNNWVLMYTFVYMGLTILYCLPRILVQMVSPESAISLIGWLGADCTSGIPLEIFAWGLLAICAGYAGLDRTALATKTSMMEVGSADYGNMEKLRRVIYLLFIVFAETVLLNLFFGKEYTVTSEIETVVFPKLNLPLEGISSALVSTVTIYILGNKGIGFTKNIDRTGGERNSETPWANEHEENIIVEDDNSK